MPLEDLKEKLYGDDEAIANRQHEVSQYDPNLALKKDTAGFAQEKNWQEGPGIQSFQKKAIKIGLIVVGIILLVTAGAVLFIRYKRGAFVESQVTLAISGPESIGSTQPAVYRITVKNDNRVALKNAELHFNYTENFQPDNLPNIQVDNLSNSRFLIGEIKARGMAEVDFPGKFYAPKDSVVFINATLSYTPSNFNNTFEAQGQKAINIQSSPISLEVNAPFEAASGNAVEYIIDYKNIGQKKFDDLKITAEYPEGFAFSSGEPQASDGNNLWYLGTLDPDQGGRIIIRGNMQGQQDEAKVVRISIGSSGANGAATVFSQKEKLTKIVTSPLKISQAVKYMRGEMVSAGDTLNYQLNFENVGNLGMRNVVVTLEIDSRVVDFRYLRLHSGSFNAENQTITWKAADFPGLANVEPGKRGSIQFDLPLLEKIPVEKREDRNFIIRTVAKIDSPDVPTPIGSNKIISSNELALKLSSKIILETGGYHQYPNFETIGQVPPVVGRETGYVLRWRLANVSNDVKNVRVVSFLPTGVVWKGKFLPENEKIYFNERTNEVVWEVGEMASGTGILNNPREVSFQVAITPQINEIGKFMDILDSATLTAEDTFIEKELSLKSKTKTTYLKEDPTICETCYKVLEFAPIQ